ncbi:hypothetical protein ACS0TY_028499 [Phlomoides rotata]
MSFSVKNSISDQEIANNGTRNAANCCSTASSELKLYQAFIFSVPILFTFILLFLFYWFYLRRRRADWSSLRMRTNNSTPVPETIDDLSMCELGLGVKKELREMLPIIVFNESFSVKDTQCSVCLGDYQAEDRLQQIPGCGHTFHIGCIDLWLTTHTTCPLCRKSLLASSNVVQVPDTDVETNTTSDVESGAEASDSQNSEDPQTTESGSID